MVSAWDVYWVLQLDGIRMMLWVVALLSLAFTTLCIAQWIEHRDFSIGRYDWPGNEPSPQQVLKIAAMNGKSPAWLARAKLFGITGALVFIAAFFVPSSRTAAAMILVPALTSPEVLQPVGAEAKELYELAKDAIRKLGDKSEPEPQK